MLKKYFLISSINNKIVFRLICDKFKKWSFYIVGALILLSLLLYSVSVMIKPLLSNLIIQSVAFGDIELLWELIKAIGTNISLISSLVYIIYKMINSRRNCFEVILEVNQVPVFLRNISMRLNSVILLSVITSIFTLSLYGASLFNSSIKVSMIILLCIYTPVQSLFTNIIVDTIYHSMSYLLYKLKIVYANIFIKLILVGILSSYFYLLLINSFSIGNQNIYNPVNIIGTIIVMFDKQIYSGLNINIIVIISMMLFVTALFGLSNNLKIEDSSRNYNVILLRKLKFLKSDKAILTKGLKEIVRNQEMILNTVLIILIIIIISVFFEDLFGNQLLQSSIYLLISTVMLYAFSHEYSMKHIYIIRGIRSRIILSYKYLPPFIISVIQYLLVSTFFIYIAVPIDIVSQSISFLLGINLFYLIGIVLPMTKNNSIYSSFTIALLMLAIIPSSLVYLQVISLLEVSEQISDMFLLVLATILLLTSLYTVRSRYKVKNVEKIKYMENTEGV